MPFNGSGTYTAPANSFNPAVSSTAVNSADWNTLLADLETALSSVLTKDGQTTATGRIPLASGIGLGDGSVSAPAMNFSADTNTGLYRIGADNLGVAIAGAKAAEFDSSGNLVLNSKNLTGVADFTATGTLTLPAGGIETADLADNLVTLAKLADQTQGDVLYYGASGAPAVLSAGTAEHPLVTKGAGADPVFQQLATAGIADNAVTLAKLADGTQGGLPYYGASGAPSELSAGTSGQFLKTQGAGADPIWDDVSAGPTSGGTLSTASGTSANSSDLGVSGPTRITLSFDNVSMDGSDNLLVQLGDSGGIETTGYVSNGGAIASGGNTVVASTTGFIIALGAAGRGFTGQMTLVHVGSNEWIVSHSGSSEGATVVNTGGGNKTLTATITQITVKPSGSNNFDGGSIQIHGE